MNEDPTGELEVCVSGNEPIYFVERQPAYYDGRLQMLIQDEAKKGKSYSIIGYKVTGKGDKVKLHVMNLEDCLLDKPDLLVDLSECPEWDRVEWQAHVDKLRAEMNKIKEEVAEKLQQGQSAQKL